MARKQGTNQERDQARKARAKARRVVSYWADGWFGPQTRIRQESIRQVLGRDLGDVVERYPMAIRKEGKRQLWDLPVLADSLGFDDPAIMLDSLAPTDPGAWLDLFQKEEREGCSAAEENAIRTALMRMMVPTCGSFELAADPWAVRWALYRENLLKRKL
jgi:hypothetical protein